MDDVGLFPILPTGSVGKGEIELAFGVGSSFIAFACLGKGNEKGKIYFPGANRPSAFRDVALAVALEWLGFPIDLSHNVTSEERNCKDPSEVAAKTTLLFN